MRLKSFYLLCAFIFSTLSSFSVEGSDFKDLFENNTVRFEFDLCGNADTTFAVIGNYYLEGVWAGSKTHLTNKLHYGNYELQLVSKAKGEILFSKGFSPLYQEWKSTAVAKVVTKSYLYNFRFPKPKQECVIKLIERQFDGTMLTLSENNFDPKSYFINSEKSEDYSTELIWGNGKNISHKVDVVMLAEGYTESEREKFISDCKRMTKALFSMAPYNEYKDAFNFVALFHPSLESGCDIPGKKLYKNTTYGSSFYTFDIPRYLTARDMKKIYKDAAIVPYDQIYVLVNTDNYGGGGFYNSINLTSVDHKLSEEVFIHEFGHGFAGLADEYYTSSTAFDEAYYSLDVEPWEPNITTMVDFSGKWKDLVKGETPIPTPRSKKYKNTIGAFEGGGYMSKGVYSPRQDCRMKTNTSKGFCAVCQRSIARVIEQYQ
ncbi:IgA Peptidase M64 [Halosquirtibacter laminarini]|uniref:IgA Peptidase M64 n=1 Tax=Halosquirtibacter laminarini TaxID=3374600 RepID=A0AC61NG43_9BACT|nr:IgA Peptidase M64 [Prolixibacteraceae bacterium]